MQIPSHVELALGSSWLLSFFSPGQAGVPIPCCGYIHSFSPAGRSQRTIPALPWACHSVLCKQVLSCIEFVSRLRWLFWRAAMSLTSFLVPPSTLYTEKSGISTLLMGFFKYIVSILLEVWGKGFLRFCSRKQNRRLKHIH